MPERSRGIVVLLSDKETGELNCTVCLLCSKACPTRAIQIDFEKGEKGKRHLKNFVVDHGLCCFCGLCEEACNFAAIKMATMYEFSTENKEDLIWDTKKLQEMGRDVPYEKPVRKKPAVKKAVPPKPAAAGEAKPAGTDQARPAEKPAEAEKKDPAPVAPAPKPEDSKPEKTEDAKPAEPENSEKKEPEKPEGASDGS
jgi:formate hydrogenlyase subunit 6/NADH:ubiquinone oxidoreductase subunit I